MTGCHILLRSIPCFTFVRVEIDLTVDSHEREIPLFETSHVCACQVPMRFAAVCILTSLCAKPHVSCLVINHFVLVFITSVHRSTDRRVGYGTAEEVISGVTCWSRAVACIALWPLVI